MSENVKQPSSDLTHSELRNEIKIVNININNIKDTILRMEKANRELQEDMKKNYVTRVEFSTVKAITYGMVALILIAVTGALLSGVIVKAVG